jgi:hypothetical protein
MTMQKIYAFAAGVILAAAAVLPAMSAEEKAPVDSGRPFIHMQQPFRPASVQQEVTGTVQDIDRTKGLVTLASSVGVLKLHFPPRSLGEIEKGDVLTAQYAFEKPGEESNRAYDAPRGLGEHTMAGIVDGVNYDTGWTRVKTDETMLELAFPPKAVRGLTPGDRITVDLSFSGA